MTKIIPLLLLDILLALQCLASGPTVYEKRIISYHTVDLLPLFVWWDHKQGARPLTRWKHLQGIMDRETPYGWLCRGSIEGQPGLQYFLIKNPPKKDLQHYRKLENELPQLEEEKASKLEFASQPTHKAYSLYTSSDQDPAIQLPVENHDAIVEAKDQVHELDARIQGVRQEMGEMLSKRGYFKIDSFALQLNETYQGSPVFDFGFPNY